MSHLRRISTIAIISLHTYKQKYSISHLKGHVMCMTIISFRTYVIITKLATFSYDDDTTNKNVNTNLHKLEKINTSKM